MSALRARPRREWILASAILGLASGVLPLASHAAPRAPAPRAKDSTARGPTPLARATAALNAASSLEKYAALRAVWRQWDQQDPALVEEVIAEAERDSSLSPPVRAYASILSGYSRRRRGDLDGARAKLRETGLVDRWATIGPFDNEGKVGLLREFGPEEELSGPVRIREAYAGKERPVYWRSEADANGYGWLDLGDRMRPREKVCGYATTFVRSKSLAPRPRALSIWAGATGALRLFWNGVEVIRDTSYRGLDADRFAARVTLEPGANRLVVKACGDQEPPVLSVRVAGPTGAPDPDLDFATLLGDAEAARAPAARADKPSGRSQVAKAAQKAARGEQRAPGEFHGAMFGPVPEFERTVAGKKPDPRSLESYARYLAVTGGDDPADHRALDLAREAAEAELTVPRALLAAELSADRNEKREWLRRAGDLPEAERDVDLWLARGDLARTGPNWRDATPFYDRVLALDPDHPRALLGRVELYGEAGLKRTALSVLEGALASNPRSVALLRAHASLLRDLGRVREADEAAERYSSLRFDDSSYLGDRVDLAVLRGDVRAATRWVDRLLATNPDSVWVLSTAASAFRSLGDNARAIGYFHRALDLAPEDVDVLRAEADLYGEMGRPDEQLRLLRQILVLKPQDKDVREYVEHIEPPKPRPDEAYAWPSDRFLRMKQEPAVGEKTRTLRDLTVTTVYQNGLASRFHQIVFQPMSDEAAASAREYAFGYQADSETVQLRAARVYREGGKIDEAVESGDAPADNPALAMYTSARTFYVHFPRLNARDIVELRYRIEDVAARNELADYFGEIVYLQRPEPLYNAEYVLRTPKARSFAFGVSPLAGLVRTERDEGELHVYDFKIDRVAPVFPEPWMPPLPEVLAHVHVSTYKTWDEVASWYWGLAKDQLIPDDEVRRRVASITEGLTDPAAKVRAIYDYVVQKTRYVALELGIYGYKPRPCALTFSRGWGDCKDKATLIVTMLKEAGIDANLVLVRSGLRGDIAPEPPSLAPFDHAIAYVPSMNLFLDGTAEYTGTLELPALDRGALALVVSEGGKGKLVRLPEPSSDATRRARHIDATLAADGTATIDLRMEAGGALAADARQRYHAKGTRAERLAHDLANDFPGFELAGGASAIEVNDLEDIEQPVHMRAKGRVPAFARREGGDLSLPVAQTGRLAPSLASLSSRTSPVRLRFHSSIDDEIAFHVPAGMHVKAAPEPARAETRFGRYALDVEQGNGKVVIRTSLSIDKTRIAPSEYAEWRAFCEAVDRAFSQRLVIGAGK